jgi:hypothetical protein
MILLKAYETQALSSFLFFSADDVRADEGLKTKKSELRLYCDLLMQQVHSVKKAVTTEPGQPDIGVSDQQMNNG